MKTIRKTSLIIIAVISVIALLSLTGGIVLLVLPKQQSSILLVKNITLAEAKDFIIGVLDVQGVKDNRDVYLALENSEIKINTQNVGLSQDLTEYIDMDIKYLNKKDKKMFYCRNSNDFLDRNNEIYSADGEKFYFRFNDGVVVDYDYELPDVLQSTFFADEYFSDLYKYTVQKIYDEQEGFILRLNFNLLSYWALLENKTELVIHEKHKNIIANLPEELQGIYEKNYYEIIRGDYHLDVKFTKYHELVSISCAIPDISYGKVPVTEYNLDCYRSLTTIEITKGNLVNEPKWVTTYLKNKTN